MYGNNGIRVYITYECNLDESYALIREGRV